MPEEKEITPETDPIVNVFPEVLQRTSIVTLKDYFTGPDGQQYRAAWGRVQILGELVAEQMLLVGTGNRQVCFPMAQFLAAVPAPFFSSHQHVFRAQADELDGDEGMLEAVGE